MDKLILEQFNKVQPGKLGEALTTLRVFVPTDLPDGDDISNGERKTLLGKNSFFMVLSIIHLNPHWDIYNQIFEIKILTGNHVAKMRWPGHHFKIFDRQVKIYD